jgi:hypothetical protein
MREFMHGQEWWGLHEDGTWVRWNRETLEWDPQASPPPEAEMHEVTAKAPPASHGEEATSAGTGPPFPQGSKVHPWSWRRTFGSGSDQPPPGSKVYRWSWRRTFGQLPSEGDPADPGTPASRRREHFMKAGRELQRAQLVLVIAMGLVFVGLIAFLLWLIDLGLHTG